MKSLFVFTLISLLFNCGYVSAALYSSTAVPGTFSPAGPPGASDDITITHDWSSWGHGNITNYTGTLTVTATGYFKVAGTFSNWHSSSIIIAAGGTLEITGGTVFRAEHVVGWGVNVVDNQGTIAIGGDFDNQFCNKCQTCADIPSCAVDPDCHWTNNGTVTVVGNYTSNGLCANILPVELISLSATHLQDGNLVKWTTASEINSEYFEIWRSSDGQNYEQISSILAAGNSNGTIDYSFIDKSCFSASQYYYKLKMVDTDGSFEYSVVVIAKNNYNAHLRQINTLDQFVFLPCEEGNYRIEAFDEAGKLISLHERQLAKNQSYLFSVGHQGFCFVAIFHNEEKRIYQKAFIQR